MSVSLHILLLQNRRIVEELENKHLKEEMEFQLDILAYGIENYCHTDDVDEVYLFSY